MPEIWADEITEGDFIVGYGRAESVDLDTEEGQVQVRIGHDIVTFPTDQYVQVRP